MSLCRLLVGRMTALNQGNHVRQFAAAVSLLGLVGTAAFAAPITYTFSGSSVSGTLGGTPFTNAQLTITATGDTSNVPDTGDGCANPTLPCNAPLVVTFTIAGVASGTITDSLLIFDNHTSIPPALGLERRSGGGDWLDISHAQFASYDLITPIGPLTVAPETSFGSFGAVATTAGNLTLTTTPDTFQATGGGGGGGGTAPAFTNGPPPNGTVGTSYSFTYTASGTTPITFSVTSGSLPSGLTLSSSGTISGPPTATGTFAGVVTATNGISPDATQSFSITIAAAPPPPPVAVQQIPTLGDAALAMLFAMLALVGWRRLRKS